MNKWINKLKEKAVKVKVKIFEVGEEEGGMRKTLLKKKKIVNMKSLVTCLLFACNPFVTWYLFLWVVLLIPLYPCESYYCCLVVNITLSGSYGKHLFRSDCIAWYWLWNNKLYDRWKISILKLWSINTWMSDPDDYT